LKVGGEVGRRWTIALIAALSCTAFVAIIQAQDGAPRATMSQGLPGGFTQTREEDDSTVTEEAPEPSDPQELEARKAKNIRYNTGGHDITILRPGVETFIEHAWPRNKLVPVAESAVIVTGTVIKVQPYLSDDRSNLYTEMTLQVENVLERDANNPVSAVNTLAIDWLGGALKLRTIHGMTTRLASGRESFS